MDGLSALILLLIAFVATTAAIYSVGYMAHRKFKTVENCGSITSITTCSFFPCSPFRFSPNQRWSGLWSN